MEKFSYLNRTNLEYIETQYQQYLQNPEQVDGEWRLFFEGIEFAQNLSPKASGGLSTKEIDVYNLIRYYRDYGHLKASLDPLKLLQPESKNFELKNFNLSDADLNSTFQAGAAIGLANAKLKDIIARLENIYCGTMGIQISECEPQVRQWFMNELESKTPTFTLSAEEKKEIFKSLVRTESLEKFIHSRFVGTKRFSVEGADALLPMLEFFVKRGTPVGIKEFVIGMAHRGRVNVLANFMDKHVALIFADFEGNVVNKSGYDGDVKYHMGYSTDKKTPAGDCHISLAYNPSHLECVNPVVMGMTRAKQRRYQDTKERKKVVPIQIHGDAAVIGQGVVAETLQLSRLPGYTVGGSLHIVINNQVGFTTDPDCGRSTRYASDVAMSIKAPVLLVNGDDVEACVRAADLALRFRHQFGQDVIIDLICYRRYGHNEGDEPSFTQPVMYDAIKDHPTLRVQYAEKLAKEGVLSAPEAEALFQEKMNNLQGILESSRKSPPEFKPNAYDGAWKGLRKGTRDDFDKVVDTKIDLKILKDVSRFLTSEPQNFNAHPKLIKLVQTRKKMVDDNHLDWGMGELLAYASLRAEGVPVRLSGQDCKRGTFSHRHAVYFDTQTGEEYCPLAQINPDKGEFCVYNSSLSEMAVLGFEYGNAQSDPTFLTIWEAQFGDFANGAQIIIDQFMAAGEEKWARVSGLTLFLPHGYEGQGPEHSSARLERFLQLCGQENMQVCNFTTPANLFHALRRQIKRDFRKPLVVMTPKSLLRHPQVMSTMEDLALGHFQETIADPRLEDPKKIENLVFCSGKVYYDLDASRAQKPNDRTAIVRVEQIYPTPRAQLVSYLNGFPKLKRVAWLQEEPKNMGAYQHIAPRLREMLDELGLKKIELEYIGRTERASPATGSPKVHAVEQKEIVEKCMQL